MSASQPQRERGRVGRWRGLPILGTLAVALLLLVGVLSRIELRTDITDLLPSGQTSAERFLLREVRSGPATGVILLGIEGAPVAELARISRAVADALDRSGVFELVNNGAKLGSGSPEQEFLFRHRYLLSPATTAEAFTEPRLRADLQRLLGMLQSSAAPLVSRFGLADPTGAFFALARDWIGSARMRSVSGVWFASDRDRALLLTKMRESGFDTAAEERASQVIADAFAAARPGHARLLASGAPIFSRDVARTIRGDMDFLAIVSTALIGTILFWRFRSFWVIAAIAIPVVLGLAAAALVVQLAFGFVHGIALGFGVTMLGVTIDYPVLLIGHRKRLEAAPATLRRIGQAFTLAVLTAALGLTGMLFSGFPGLSQLGLFSVVGLLVAAAATRWLLPRLIVAADLAPVQAGDPARLLRIERWRAWRGASLVVTAVAAAYLVAVGGPAWQRNLAALTPVPKAALDLDAELRAELGAPDAGQIGVVRGPSAEAVLRQQEKLLPVLHRLRQEGVINGAEIAARFLPSRETQLARRAALPVADELAARVAAAQAGLPFRATALQPFIDDVAAARTMPPIGPADMTDKAMQARLDALLFQRGETWFGLIAPTGVRDPARVAEALQQAGALYVDTGEAISGIVATYTRSALRWLGLGALVAIGALLVGLRDPLRVVRVVASIAASALVTLAVLTALGSRLSLISIVALQFVCGVGLDYALFFARRQLDEEERARTLRTLATCNVMTLTTFGLLAVCRTPLLREIGQTVVTGALSALCFAFLFAGPRIGREAA